MNCTGTHTHLYISITNFHQNIEHDNATAAAAAAAADDEDDVYA